MFKVEEEKQWIKKEQILELVDESNLFRYYCPSFRMLGKPFCSELRNEGNPSCSIQVYPKGVFYKDFGSGDFYTIFSYLQKKFSCSYYEALLIINNDFKLDLLDGVDDKPSMGYFGLPEVNTVIDISVKERTVIKVKIRDWDEEDRVYWNEKYGVSKSTLEKFSCYPLEAYTVYKGEGNRFDFTCNKLTYGYYFEEGVWKIYSPLEEGTGKHISNLNSDNIFGYSVLPYNGDRVIITSSPKDVIVWGELGEWAICPMSEASFIPEDKVLELQKRFKKIYINNDNDLDKDQNWGQINAKKFIEKYPFVLNLVLPMKDISDLIEEKRKEETLKIIKELL